MVQNHLRRRAKIFYNNPKWNSEIRTLAGITTWVKTKWKSDKVMLMIDKGKSIPWRKADVDDIVEIGKDKYTCVSI